MITSLSSLYVLVIIHTFKEYLCKKGSTPILKAKITQQVNLENLALNLKDELFSTNFENTVGNAGGDWGNKPTYRKSFIIQNPAGTLDAKQITTLASCSLWI